MVCASSGVSPALLMACRGMLRIGTATVSASFFYELKCLGYQHIIDVSGLGTWAFWPRDLTRLFEVSRFSFSDVFSVPARHSLLPSKISPILYQKHVLIAEQQAFAAAVAHARICLIQQREGVYLCCQQGYGRSPAVALATLMSAFDLPTETALTLVKTLHPHARLTEMSIAASLWYRTHLIAQN
ncbi:dual specificity protein phosphatase family protein [Thioflexithrix psekupsensis]|uniref:Tyrosine specific protein phosphatases domain-containing protein n=1 Tax=Thioflexithrix psekupsensis TaxID=1570016 RepID=A0A251X7B6_9GAMM|nr:dual specificity protein phosphatase family protein [Thioflexithrix psekupsensis]OUD13079.1 hypothetical protein TPSD3_10540 [Thioflexithrix psekupsensis]